MNSTQLEIDIVSDVVCPWCVIGYKRLEKALTQFEDLSWQIRWHPFELNPSMAEGGENLREHVMNKYGIDAEESVTAREKITEYGEELGFQFNYFDEMRMYNTRNAHKLIHWASEFGKQTELKLKFFEVFFTEQASLEDQEILLASAKAVGLDDRQAKQVLEDESWDRLIVEQESLWQNQGIHAVPAFVVNRKFLINGALPVENFVDALKQILTQSAEN